MRGFFQCFAYLKCQSLPPQPPHRRLSIVQMSIVCLALNAQVSGNPGILRESVDFVIRFSCEDGCPACWVTVRPVRPREMRRLLRGARLAARPRECPCGPLCLVSCLSPGDPTTTSNAAARLGGAFLWASEPISSPASQSSGAQFQAIPGKAAFLTPATWMAKNRSAMCCAAVRNPYPMMDFCKPSSSSPSNWQRVQWEHA